MRHRGEKVPRETIEGAKPEVGWLHVDDGRATFARHSGMAWPHEIFTPLDVRRIKIRGAIFVFGNEVPRNGREAFPQVWMCRPAAEPETDRAGFVVESDGVPDRAFHLKLDMPTLQRFTGRTRGPCAECQFNGGLYSPEARLGSVICTNPVGSGRHVCRMPEVGCAAFKRRMPGDAAATDSSPA